MLCKHMAWKLWKEVREPRDNGKRWKGIRDEHKDTKKTGRNVQRSKVKTQWDAKKMKPVGVDNIFKRFSCEEEEQDVRGLYAKLI